MALLPRHAALSSLPAGRVWLISRALVTLAGLACVSSVHCRGIFLIVCPGGSRLTCCPRAPRVGLVLVAQSVEFDAGDSSNRSLQGPRACGGHLVQSAPSGAPLGGVCTPFGAQENLTRGNRIKGNSASCHPEAACVDFARCRILHSECDLPMRANILGCRNLTPDCPRLSDNGGRRWRAFGGHAVPDFGRPWWASGRPR